MVCNGGGSIVNMLFIIGCYGFEGQVFYVVLKVGLIGVSLVVVKELVYQQIWVNVVVFGYIDMDLNCQYIDEVY